MFISYCAQTLPRTVQSDLLQHLTVCEPCRVAAQRQAAIWSALEEWEAPLVSPDFDRKLYSRIDSEEQQPWPRFLAGIHWSWRPVMPVAAACAAVLAAFLLKEPAHDSKPDYSVLEKKVDIELVERALDDIEMLKQLGVVPAPAGPSSKSEPF